MSAISGVGSGSSAWSQISSSSGSDRKQRLFAKADSNGDGTVDATELQNFLDKGAERTGGTAPNAADLMKTADTDGSGGLDADEFDAGMKSLAPAAGSTVEFAHHHGGMQGGPPPSDDDASSTDGSATSDLTTSLQNLFQAADTNGDGSLDTSELATLKTNIDTAIQSLESGGGGTTASSSDTTTASSSTGSTISISTGTGTSDGSSTTGGTSTDSAQATWLDLTQLVLKEYASNAAAASSTGQTTAISLTA